MRGFFVTGTDTGVGKTQFTCALLHALALRGERAVGMKPVASGCEDSPAGLRSADAEAIRAAASVSAAYAEVNPYAFAPPIAPHWAARAVGVALEIADLAEKARRLALRADWLVVEGAGGVLVPLNERALFADLAADLGLPVILVVGLRVGAINHALLSAEAIRHRKLSLAGWLGNQPTPEAEAPGTLETLRDLLPAPYLGMLPYVAHPQPWTSLHARVDLDQILRTYS